MIDNCKNSREKDKGQAEEEKTLLSKKQNDIKQGITPTKWYSFFAILANN